MIKKTFLDQSDYILFKVLLHIMTESDYILNLCALIASDRKHKKTVPYFMDLPQPHDMVIFIFFEHNSDTSQQIYYLAQNHGMSLDKSCF